MGRQMHRNGVECIHGLFLHEKCKDCRIEELESQLELERRMHKRTTKYLNDANLDIDLRQAISDGFSGAMMEAEKERDGLKKILETIDGLHVFKGDELVKTFNGNFVSPDDFVSATELKAALKGWSGYE